MLLLEALVVALMMSLAARGSLKRLAASPLRGEVVLLVLLPLQMIWPSLTRSLRVACPVATALWLVLMGSLAGILFLNASRSVALAVAGLGIALNVLVIGLNGAMPVSLRASSELGVSRAEASAALAQDCLHESLEPSAHLPFLADVIAVPGPDWHRGIISVGDCLLILGLCCWVYVASRPASGSTRLHAEV